MKFTLSDGVRCLIGMRVGRSRRCEQSIGRRNLLTPLGKHTRHAPALCARSFGRLLITGVAAAGALLVAETGIAREFSSYASVEEDGSLRVGTRKVHLYGIYIPPTGQHCRTFFSPPVCGSRATIALEFKIQGFVHCREKSSNRDRSVNATCYVKRSNFSEGEDLGAYLIQQGWAMARPEAPFEYHALEKIARQQSAGIWGFTIDGVQRKR
jgi:endonuclease YncB( thermonuclease family)